MSKEQDSIHPTDFLLSMGLSDDENFTFGKYMRAVRKAQNISVRQLAKALNKTPTYISDIENGNNRPPDKELLDSIVTELKLDEFPRVKDKLYDLSAYERGDIPADIKKIIIDNPELITILRSYQACPRKKEMLSKMVSITSNGGINNDAK